MSKRSKTLTTPAAIRAAFANLKTDSCVQIRFKPLTDDVWIRPPDDEDDCETFGDAAGDSLWTGLCADIVRGRTLQMTVTSVLSFGVEFRHDARKQEQIRVGPQHVAALCVLPGPKSVEIDGLRNGYKLTLKPDGTVSVGCQTLTRKGCEQAFRALAEHLGYTVTD